MGKPKKGSWSRLDQIALDVEFLLISVIQGVALATLAASSILPIETLEWQYFPYIATAFLLVLIFWSGAIIHALSFIDWPLDLTHNFLYFLASFIEVLAFSHVTNPFLWFVFILAFQIVAAILYIYDLSMIRNHHERFNTTPQKRSLFLHIFTQQQKEVKTFVPLAIIYSLISLFCIFQYPQFFLDKNYHVFLILGQMIFSIIFLINETKNFRMRSSLLQKAEE